MKDALVGINYFAGWWKPFPNKWHRHKSSLDTDQGQDWRPDFPERVPLLGQYNDQETMDKEIVAAADHGVDFFPILWYYNEPDGEREPNARFLNDGVKYFMNSPNSSRMKFYIEFCNHPPYEVSTDQQWSQCLDEWSGIFAHPSYMRVGERLVFKIHGAEHFITQNKGDIGRCQKQIDSLRNAVRKAGLGEMIIGGGVMSVNHVDKKNPIAELFDFTCVYMDIPPHSRMEGDYPYEMLADLARTDRYVHCYDAIAHMPFLPGGWCPRPWPDERACFEFPNRQQWTLELSRMKQDLGALPNMGLPLPDGSVQPAFNCYAWNEFGEGGILAPTQGDKYMKIECIKEVFGTD